MNIAVWIESNNNKIKKSSLEVLAQAGRLAQTNNAKLSALYIGETIKDIESQLKTYGVSSLYHANVSSYNTVSWAEQTAKFCSENSINILLASLSANSKDTFPRVAAQLDCGMISEVTHLELTGNTLKAKRPVYAGKLIANIEANLESPVVVTCRPNVFDPKPEVAESNTQSNELEAAGFSECGRCKLLEVKATVSDRPDLAAAEIVVSAGRSIKSEENFTMINELADVLGAAVGASRAAVDAGYASHDMQVGQTGKTVNPKLYIACGISGAIQHLAGMSSSKVIVAINTDPEAPIFQKADYGIVGDMFELVPLMKEEFAKLLQE
ncbi:MAG TPA: electron transfer flavoprotein subunit alpha/FixB family protein [Oligoflexia bacterium]|nr:electron transfer flavoprotein subunit alpha/FixB family protein [Oligoflexia bacterium]HMR23733.1 electron transfer flavoprotein subunit alpha/FixB family protein [Oligoflexia bacterium]